MDEHSSTTSLNFVYEPVVDERVRMMQAACDRMDRDGLNRESIRYAYVLSVLKEVLGGS